MASAPPPRPLLPIYWERQESALCGTHCLNSLLQGPWFNEVDMSSIALTIDERERALMAEGGLDAPAYLAFMAADSSNVDASGNFSLNVLRTCMENVGCNLIPLDAPECAPIRAAPTHQEAFLCNHQSHWFALRKLHGRWWNLNSLQHDNGGWGPSPVGELYLSVLLDELRAQKHTIFVVQGTLPSVDTTADVRGRGRWFDVNEVLTYHAGGNGLRRQQQANAAALNAAVRSRAPGVDPELARALAASQLNVPMGGSDRWPPPGSDAARHASSSGGSSNAAMDDDDDFQRALQLSMASVPHAPPPAPVAAAAGAAAPAASSASPAAAAAAASSAIAIDESSSEDAEELQRAIALSMQGGGDEAAADAAATDAPPAAAATASDPPTAASPAAPSPP